MFNRDTVTLILEDVVTPQEEVNLKEFIKSSDGFPAKFPKDTARCKVLQNSVHEKILERNINSTYPLLHEDALELYAKFILEKRKSGSPVEKTFYRDFTVLKLVQRFLEKRARTFLGRRDKFVLLDGSKGFGGWETVGTPSEKPPLTLENCLSYDEIKLSAFLSVSSHSHFVNSGNRRNAGKPETDRSKIEEDGVVVALIGPRLAKVGVMDHQDVVFSKTSAQTIPNLMKNFYKITYPCSGQERSSNPNCVRVRDKYFDNHVYRKRLAVSFDTVLIEANQRAREAGKKAFIHMVGIGLGVWKLSPHQEKIFLDEFVSRIKELSENLHFVSDVRFGHFESKMCGEYPSGEKVPIEGHPNGGIKLHVNFEDPYLKLKGEDGGKLLVVTFAWNGNALPGNEFWGGRLSSSGDPAAACSTQIAELHNAHINPKCSKDNLKIATKKGVFAFSDYQEMLEKDQGTSS